MVHKNNSTQTEATSIVLQINNTIQKIQNSCTLVKLKYHVNSSMADWTTTSLTEHFVVHDSQKRWWPRFPVLYFPPHPPPAKRSRIYQSCISHPCSMVPHFLVLRLMFSHFSAPVAIKNAKELNVACTYLDVFRLNLSQTCCTQL